MWCGGSAGPVARPLSCFGGAGAYGLFNNPAIAGCVRARPAEVGIPGDAVPNSPVWTPGGGGSTADRADRRRSHRTRGCRRRRGRVRTGSERAPRAAGAGRAGGDRQPGRLRDRSRPGSGGRRLSPLGVGRGTRTAGRQRRSVAACATVGRKGGTDRVNARYPAPAAGCTDLWSRRRVRERAPSLASEPSLVAPSPAASTTPPTLRGVDHMSTLSYKILRVDAGGPWLRRARARASHRPRGRTR
jgi:hypothetical protein